VAISLPRYETDQLISVIGSKRPIAEHLRIILSSLAAHTKHTLFLDPFCGSGTVSRIARSLGFSVRASDLEPFSFIINHVYLTLSHDDLLPLFTEMGGIDAYLSLLNLEGLYASLERDNLSHAYLSRHYAPQSDTHFDANKERLFFTPGNARFIDAVRDEIEHAWLEKRITAREKAILLTSIIYEASRKANTSGSFTAYHKRFTTERGKPRTRIVEPCQLRAPVLPDVRSSPPGEMFLCDASDLVKRYSADICYLDPPATVHQYGSAYHLLNSITLWDNYTPSNRVDANGKLRDRSGIRTDWKKTHSPFCSLQHADAAFVHLLNSIDARHIVLTYPSDGIVSAERIYELLQIRNSPVTVLPLYKRNRGGPQGNHGKKQIEQVFITGKTASLAISVGKGLELLPLFERLDVLTQSVFKSVITLDPFSFIGGIILDGLPGIEVLMAISENELAHHIDYLEKQRCSSDEEAMSILFLSCVQKNPFTDGAERARLEKRLFSLLRRHLEHTGEKEKPKVLARFLQLLEQVGPTDVTTSPMIQRLFSFLKIAYDESAEDSREP
jgi:adenine-specific DNA-methyltransferase